MTQATKIQVSDELFAGTESSYFSGELEKPSFSSGGDTYSFARPLLWQVYISNVGGALLVAGSVEGIATADCARCLTDSTFNVKGEIEGYFLIPGVEHEDEDLEEDEFDTLSDDNCIDMEPLIDAALLLALPLVPLCDEECAGLCHRCGTNLNKDVCSCEPDQEEDVSDNPFAILKDLNFEN